MDAIPPSLYLGWVAPGNPLLVGNWLAFSSREVVGESTGSPSGAQLSEVRRPHGSLGPLPAIVAVTIAGVAAFLNLYITQPLLPLLIRLFGVSEATAGMTISASTLGVAFAAPLAGILAEKVGRRRVIVASTFLLALPTVLAATSSSLNVLIFWRFLQGLLMPGIFGVTIAYITEEWAPDQVTTVMSIYVSGSVIGGFMGRVISGMAATHALIPGMEPSWKSGFAFVAALDIVCGIFLLRWLPADHRHTHEMRHEGLQQVLEHLRNTRLVATYAAGFSILFTLVAIFTYITFHLAAEPYLLSPAELSWLFVVYLVGVFVTPIAGIWMRHVGPKKALLVAVVIGLFGALNTLSNAVGWILVGLILCSCAVFVCQSACTSYIGQAAPPGSRSSAAGLYVCFYYIGGCVGGVLPGYFWPWGGWKACIFVVLIVQVITFAVTAIGWKNVHPVLPAEESILP